LNTNLYIFLDIDGVLNTRNHLIRQKKVTGKCSNMDWCPIACNNILRLCKKFGARIIVSSSWRHQYSLEKLKTFFEMNGIPSDFIIGTTPSTAEQSDNQNYCRGHEVKQWLYTNEEPNASYVIIDDDYDMLDSQLNNFVHVTLDEGFASSQAMIQALQIVNKQRL